MNLKLKIISRLQHGMVALSRLLARRWKRNFYLYLAVVFTIFAIVDTAALHITASLRQATFDAMVRYRIAVPKPDPDIVIVDINEASLAAMAKEYGRWPWPRQVLGEFVEQIEKQQPKAIVFDILFSDADVYNAESDKYFNDAIAHTNNTFFPMLRLDPANDGDSKIKPSMLPGVFPMQDEVADPEATIAMITPFLPAAVEGGRLGVFNIYPDSDGIARRYPSYLDEYGWMIPSIPTRMAQEFGWKTPDVDEVLLNWRGKPGKYHYVGFSDVYFDLGREHKQRPPDEFKDKIVIIGATAAGLFDLKATPVARMFPGVEVMATAIDNLKHGDWLRSPEGPVWALLATLAIVWAVAWAFFKDVGRSTIDRLFGLSQFILIVASYASINLTNTYINLTGPVMVGLAFFSLARVYASATSKALEQNMVRAAAERKGDLRATLLLIRFDTNRNVVPDGVVEKIRLALGKTGAKNKSLDVLSGYQKGMWGLFEKTIAVSWLVEANDAAAVAAVEQDVQTVLEALPPLLRKHFAYPDGATHHYVHSGLMYGGEAAQAGWRALFAETLLEWDRSMDKP